jgi:isocitrate dehydrogenase kinase/phosphatase
MSESWDQHVVVAAAEYILNAFRSQRGDYADITLRARMRFESQDWVGMQADGRERFEVYTLAVSQCVDWMDHLLGASLSDVSLWMAIKTHYARLIASSVRYEVAATFFNSLTRRIFPTFGVNPAVEFVEQDIELRAIPRRGGVDEVYWIRDGLEQAIREMLTRHEFVVPYAHFEDDIAAIVQAIDLERTRLYPAEGISRIEMLQAEFYRGTRAFLVGRMRVGHRTMPLVLSLGHGPRGVIIDAALVTQNAVSILFSFTRSYFHVDVERPAAVVQFLRSIMPNKRLAELYTSIGFHKHGKTELYRDLLRHIDLVPDQFRTAPGQRGMVMIVFTLPAFDIVFKVIRDRFSPPKNTTRQEVMDKYHLVFTHDRAGRLVDAQEFEHLSFDRSLFDGTLLDELLEEAASTVAVEEGRVCFKHLYTERRITPLNLFLEEADEAAARSAVLEYGQAIKDLAATNIFPGDLLIKNFGVTRHGRVIFYDYDELCLLEECRFRPMPEPRTHEEEMSSEPWFYVGPHDVFPQEFLPFLGLRGAHRDTFLQHHGDLLDHAFWTNLQQRHAEGLVTDCRPYSAAQQLRSEASGR